MNNYHIPVLLQEVLEYLDVTYHGLYIDGTLGGGGHTFEIIKRGGRVLGFDVDNEAITHVKEKLRQQHLVEGKDLTIVQQNFSHMAEVAPKVGFEKVDGVLLDLGVSSHQFDKAERGFSFHSGPLDMRMGSDLQILARDLVNGLTEKELVGLLEKYGEEPFARKIAKAIVEKRKVSPFETTDELAQVIKSNIRGDKGIHPATRTFQALRIAVNDELYVLQQALPQALELLKPGGKLVVISFHSLEDRIVKKTFEEFSIMHKCKILTDKPIMAEQKEVLQNNRSRSAKLRALEKI